MMTKLLSFLAWIIVKLFRLSYRFQEINPEVLEKVKESSPNGAYIFAIWHQNIFASILSFIGTPHATMASQSKDGEIIAQVLERLNYKIARGSSSRGGRKALIELVRFMKDGFPGAMTVDGPKGPAHEVKKGVFELAKITSLPIVPYACYPVKYWAFTKSWDKFRLPKPFTKVYMRYGEPIVVTKDMSSDEYQKLSESLKFQLEDGERKAIEYANQA